MVFFFFLLLLFYLLLGDHFGLHKRCTRERVFEHTVAIMSRDVVMAAAAFLVTQMINSFFALLIQICPFFFASKKVTTGHFEKQKQKQRQNSIIRITSIKERKIRKKCNIHINNKKIRAFGALKLSSRKHWDFLDFSQLSLLPFVSLQLFTDI